jgi:prevent-host-death family protein
MSGVTIRELRNHGGDVVDRVVQGETLIVTRDGRPVAELRPLRGPVLSATTLLPVKLLADIDEVLDPQL